jgi:hypothetical protein
MAKMRGGKSGKDGGKKMAPKKGMAIVIVAKPKKGGMMKKDCK